MKSSQYTYTSVTEQRGVKRLWLQGLRLQESGFGKGDRYRVDYDLDSELLHIVADPNGDRVVSGRKRGERLEAIVDICNASVVEFAGDAVRVRADFFIGRITFSISHRDRAKQDREARFAAELTDGRLTEGSICTGIGMAAEATHEGFARMGVQTSLSWVIDRDRRYLQAALDNTKAINDDTVLFEAALEDIETELLTPVSILQASLPCTGHSRAGKSKNKIKVAEAHKTDATAAFGFLRILEAVNPSIVISENVCAARNSATYLMLKSYLTMMDYTIEEVDIGPNETQSVETRRRYWFVAVSKGLSNVDLSRLPEFTRQYANIGELLDELDENDASWSENSYLKSKQKRDAAAGKGFANRCLLRPEDTSIATAPRTYAKRQSTSPFLTRDDGKERLFTPVELCRAHSAPLHLIDGLSNAVAYEGLGQGIDFRAGLAIAMVIARDVCASDTEVVMNNIAKTVPEKTEPAEAEDLLEKSQLALFG